jgi:hypothetical protein
VTWHLSTMTIWHALLVMYACYLLINSVITLTMVVP